jgi:hypothetical protein
MKGDEYRCRSGTLSRENMESRQTWKDGSRLFMAQNFENSICQNLHGVVYRLILSREDQQSASAHDNGELELEDVHTEIERRYQPTYKKHSYT